MDLGYLRYSSALGFGGKMSPCHPFFVVRICILEWVFTPYGIKMFRYLNKVWTHGFAWCWYECWVKSSEPSETIHPIQPVKDPAEDVVLVESMQVLRWPSSISFPRHGTLAWDGIPFQMNESYGDVLPYVLPTWMLKSVGTYIIHGFYGMEVSG